MVNLTHATAEIHQHMLGFSSKKRETEFTEAKVRNIKAGTTRHTRCSPCQCFVYHRFQSQKVPRMPDQRKRNNTTALNNKKMQKIIYKMEYAPSNLLTYLQIQQTLKKRSPSFQSFINFFIKDQMKTHWAKAKYHFQKPSKQQSQVIVKITHCV